MHVFLYERHIYCPYHIAVYAIRDGVLRELYYHVHTMVPTIKTLKI